MVSLGVLLSIEESQGRYINRIIYSFLIYFIVKNVNTNFCVYLFDYRHHQHGRWQARIGRVAGNKDLYLGTFGNLCYQ